MRSFGVGLMAILIMPPPASAAAPPFIPVQGVLTDSAGLPVEGEVQAVFSIYAGPGGDPALWSETHTMQVENGVFAVYLGQTSDLDLALFRDHSELYLGIRVGEDSEMPRIYLGSTPFAGYAEYAGGDVLGTLSCGNWQVVKWNGSAWACANDNDADTLSGLSCADGQVPRWNLTAWECADDVDTNTDTLAELSCGNGQVAKYSGSAWACANDLNTDTDTDTLADLNCTTGQLPKWSGSAWVCGNDLNTDNDTLGDLSCAAGQVPQWNAGAWECSQKLSWTSLEINLGGLNFTPGTISYDIPAAVPGNAREVLVYIWVRKGGLATPTGIRTWKFYTQQGTDIYFKKIMMHAWENNGITYNSDNQWLPVTSQRQIHIQMTGGSVTGDYGGGIEIIGYR